MKVLIMGLPGSGKTTLAIELAKILSCTHFNADEVRREADDWDFSVEGRIRQADRMKRLADTASANGNICISDFVCPTETTRNEFGADFIIWMNTIDSGRFEDTNKVFDPPKTDEVDLVVSDWNYDVFLIAKTVATAANGYNVFTAT